MAKNVFNSFTGRDLTLHSHRLNIKDILDQAAYRGTNKNSSHNTRKNNVPIQNYTLRNAELELIEEITRAVKKQKAKKQALIDDMNRSVAWHHFNTFNHPRHTAQKDNVEFDFMNDPEETIQDQKNIKGFLPKGKTVKKAVPTVLST